MLFSPAASSITRQVLGSTSTCLNRRIMEPLVHRSAGTIASWARGSSTCWNQPSWAHSSSICPNQYIMRSPVHLLLDHHFTFHSLRISRSMNSCKEARCCRCLLRWRRGIEIKARYRRCSVHLPLERPGHPGSKPSRVHRSMPSS